MKKSLGWYQFAKNPTIDLFFSFDSSERYLTSAKDSAPVFFFGVLIIDKLEWLSGGGRDVLQKELKKRDKTLSTHRSSQNSQKASEPRNLTLAGLYDKGPHKGFKLSVCIFCEKHSPAMFMTGKYFIFGLYAEPEYRCRQGLPQKSRSQFERPVSMSQSDHRASTNWRQASVIPDTLPRTRILSPQPQLFRAIPARFVSYRNHAKIRLPTQHPKN